MDTRLAAQTIAMAAALAALSCGDKKNDTAGASGGQAQAAAGRAAAGTQSTSDSAPPKSDPRCPEVELSGGTTLPSGCDANNQCGVNPAMFGTPFCLDLMTAADQAKSLGADAKYPSPRACDAGQ